MTNGKLVLGTRGSELARAQARLVEQALREKWPQLVFETKVVRVLGDERAGDSAIVDLRAGRKGLFTSEIERALINGDVDLAIHSAKDLASALTSGTEISAALPRAPVDDVLIALTPYDLVSLPVDGIVATGSVRRKHQLHWKRSDVEIVDLRGNVPTRLRKLAEKRWHAVVLARAGLERLGLKSNGAPIDFEGNKFFSEILPREVFLPAGGQGVIAIQTRADDDRAKMLTEAINDLDTRLCLRAEREFLRLVDGDCNQPIGVLATIDGKNMNMRAQIFEPGGATPREGIVTGDFEGAESLAAALFAQIN